MSESSEKTDNTKRGDKRGILRVDINKPRNSSGSVEFRNQPELLEVNKQKSIVFILIMYNGKRPQGHVFNFNE